MPLRFFISTQHYLRRLYYYCDANGISFEFVLYVGGYPVRDFGEIISIILNKKFQNTSQTESGKELPRYVCQVIFEPLIQVYNTCKDKNLTQEALENLLNTINIKLSQSESNRSHYHY